MVNEDLDYRTAEATTERARLELYKQREQGYVASRVYTVPSGGGTVNMHVHNPADSNFAVDVVRFLFASQFTGQVSIYDQFSTAPSDGTTVPVDNLVMDEGGDNGSTMGSIDIARGVTFTASGSPHFEGVLPSGGTGGTGVGGALSGTEPILEPGREMVLELQNDAADPAAGSIGIVYLEREDI